MTDMTSEARRVEIQITTQMSTATTLFDLIADLQSQLHEDEHFVTKVVTRLSQAGCLRWLRPSDAYDVLSA
jgi:hypothetical protein